MLLHNVSNSNSVFNNFKPECQKIVTLLSSLEIRLWLSSGLANLFQTLNNQLPFQKTCQFFQTQVPMHHAIGCFL